MKENGEKITDGATRGFDVTERKNMMGKLLIEEGLLNEEQLNIALKAQKENGGRLGYHLIRLGFINVSRLSQFLKDAMGVVPFNISEDTKIKDVLDIIPASLARFYNVIPIEKKGDVLTVALADLDNPMLIPALEELTGLKIDPLICPREVVVEALEKFYGFKSDQSVVISRSSDNLFILSNKEMKIKPLHWSALKPDSSAVDWLRATLVEAIRIGCRRVLIKPNIDFLRIAFQSGNLIEDRFLLNPRKEEEFSLLIEELAKLKEARKRPEVEGRFRVQIENRFLSLNVHKIQTIQGRRYRLTIYDEKIFVNEWEKIREKLCSRESESLEKSLSEKNGLIVICGTSPSAISSTYYTIIEAVKRRYKNMFSIENNCLFNILNINQVELSRVEETSLSEQITLAMKDTADFIAVNPLKDRGSAELIFLASANIPTLAVLYQDNPESALKWLLRNGFKSPIRAGILKGILSVIAITDLCPDCKIPLESTFSKYQLWTRQGCQKCLSLDFLPYSIFFEWIPIKSEYAPSSLEDIENTIYGAKQFLNYPLSIEERIMEVAKKGEIDGSEVRKILKI